MTKAEFVDQLALKLGLSKAKADETLKVVLDSIVDTTEETGRLLVCGCLFKKVTRKARQGRNPQTGETITIPERTDIVFRKHL